MSLLRDTFMISTSRAISLILTVGVASASAWLLGPEGRGELAMYMILGTLLMIATSSGVEMAGAYYAGTNKHTLSNILPAIIFVVVASTLLSAGVAYLLWIYQVGFIKKVTNLGLVFTVFYVPAFLLCECLLWMNSALGNLKIYAVGQIVNRAITLGGILILCWHTRMPEYAVAAYILGCICVVSLLLLYVVLHGSNVLPLHMSSRCIKDMYTYGIKYFFARIAQFLNVQIGTFVIAFVGTTAQTGLFSAAIGLVAKMTVLPEILNVVLLGRVVKDQEASLALTAKAVRTTFWVILFASLILAAFCHTIVAVLLSPRFLPIVMPVWFLLPGMLLRCCSKTLGVYFNGIGRPEINSIAIISAVATNVVMMLWLLPKFGITGAAIAATCGYVIDAAVLVTFYRVALKHQLGLLIPRVGDIKSLISTLIHRRPPQSYN